MRSVLFVFSLLLSGAILQCGAQSKKELFSKAAKQHHLRTKAGNLAGFTGKSGMLPDSIEQYSYDPFKKEYSEFPNSTEHFTYDQNGNVVERITHRPPYNSQRETYVYSNGKEIESIRYDWNPSTSSWFAINRYQVLSNQFGIDTAEIYSVYDTSNQTWILGSWYVYSIEYDSYDRPLYSINYEYDALAQIRTNYVKVEFNYTGTDTLPSELYVYEWDGANWNKMFWVPRVEWELGFSPNLDYFEPTLIVGNEWDGANWAETFYDSSVVVNGQVADYYSFTFDEDSQYYILTYSSHYSYDTYGNQTSSLDLEWGNGQSDTSYASWNEIVYGSNGEVREWVYRSYSGGSGMEYRTKDIYYYGANSLVSAEKMDVTLYPNPVGLTQKLFIISEQTINQVHLYAANGILLKSWNLPNGDGLDMQGIAPGLYFVYLLGETGNASTQRVQVR